MAIRSECPDARSFGHSANHHSRYDARPVWLDRVVHRDRSMFSLSQSHCATKAVQIRAFTSERAGPQRIHPEAGASVVNRELHLHDGDEHVGPGPFAGVPIQADPDARTSAGSCFMARGISLAPVGLVVERLETTSDKITVLARPSCETAACPNCAQVSKSVHSRYQWSLSDLPSGGRRVQIIIRVRRFRCGQTDCPRRVFAERLEPAVTTAFSRRTERLEGIVHHLGLALGGRPPCLIGKRQRLPRGLPSTPPSPSSPATQTEGQNTKLKLVKGQMYGRANLDLLRARLLGAA